MSEQAEKGEWPSEVLPASWVWVDFRTAWTDETDSKRKLKASEYLDSGPLPVVDQGEGLIGGYSDNVDLKNLTELPCVIFGDHTRAIKFIDFEFAQGADGVKVLRPNGQYDPRFAWLALRCVRLPNKGYSRHFKFLKSTAFPVPPLPEQRRIVAKLDRLSARSAAARDHLARTTKLAARAKQAVLAAAFDHDVMASWTHTTVGEVVSNSLVGLVRSKAQQSEIGTPYIRMNHFDLDGLWNEDGLTCVDVSDAEMQKYELRGGDVVFNTRNSVELVGKVAIWPEGRFGCVYNNNLLRLRFFNGLDPRFVYLWMISPQFRRFLETVKSATTSVAAIYLKSLLQGPVAYPDKEEQARIVHRIEAAFARIDRMTEEAARAAHLLDRLEERLLAKAFRGELVPQDPSDEPAEALLARIREARAAAPKPKPTRGRRKAQA